jgi:hypothetical protein
LLKINNKYFLKIFSFINIISPYDNSTAGCEITRNKKRVLNLTLILMVIAAFALLNFVLYKLTAV